ncbi:MAG: hypothetical protein IT578_02425 [Verrucomicrobiae bacterium]|nr:hypothetical protein [Verrucomicrobiae bacterium]
MKAWCAYSAAWWEEPRRSKRRPPGLVICGEDDAARYGASLIYFKQGRALGKPWLWLSVPRSGHRPESRVEEFVRHYFAAALNGDSHGVWVDLDLKRAVAEDSEPAVLTGWLPDSGLMEEWRTIHEP